MPEIKYVVVDKIGIVSGRYSYSTAVGLFKNVIGTILIFSTNRITKKLGGATLF